MKELEDIFIREIERLNTASKRGALDIEDVRKLDMLTRAWKSYSGNQIVEESDPLEGMTLEQKLALASMDIEGD